MRAMDTFERELAAITCRVLHFGVPAGDFLRAAGAGGWPGWSACLAAAGEGYLRAAEDAIATGLRVSAGELGRRAAACFHYAQLRLPPGPAREDLAGRCRAAYALVAALFTPPARRLAIPIHRAGGHLPGYLRRARPDAPLVVLINGLDSAKEVELDRFAEGFLARGSSVFVFDAPGQGEAPGPLAMESFDAAIAAVLGHLAGPGAGPVGFFGVSFGGHLACRAAALEPRVVACISLGGFYDSHPLRRLPPTARERLRQASGPAGPEALADTITLAPLAGRLDRPLLIAHGTADHLVDAAQVDALASWGGPRVEVRRLDGAEHACTDRFGELLPELWDWMTARLSETPARAGATAPTPVEVAP